MSRLANVIPRFIAFLFLSTCAFCLLIGAPSYNWLELSHYPQLTFGIFGYCRRPLSSDDYTCIELDADFLADLKSNCDNVDLPWSGPNCVTRVRQWRVDQRFDLLGLFSASAAAICFLIQAIASIKGVSFRITRCFGSRVSSFANFISWSGLIFAAVASISSVVTSAVSHSLLDSIIEDPEPHIQGDFHWPWFASVAAATFSCTGLMFGILFNNARQLRAILQPVIDPELDAYNDSAYIQVGNEPSQFSGNSTFPYTQHV